MSDLLTEALTRRRLGGAVLVLVGIVVALIVVWPNGDDEPAGAGTTTSRLPVRFVAVPPLGLGFAHPTTWKRTVRNRVIELRSPDGDIEVFLASPLARPGVQLVLDEAKAELRRQFAPATIVNEGRQPLGRRNVRSFELRGHDAKKRIVRGLVLVDSTDYRTYTVTLLSSATPRRARLREAREILATVRFDKPKALTAKPSG